MHYVNVCRESIKASTFFRVSNLHGCIALLVNIITDFSRKVGLDVAQRCCRLLHMFSSSASVQNLLYFLGFCIRTNNKETTLSRCYGILKPLF